MYWESGREDEDDDEDDGDDDDEDGDDDEDEGGGEEEEEEKVLGQKSNNPNLKGGEKTSKHKEHISLFVLF